MPIAWVDGEFVDERAARVSVFDRGFLFGDSVFETLRAEDRIPIFWPEHRARLDASCRRAEIRATPPPDLAAIIDRCLAENVPDGVARVRITVSSGVGDLDGATGAGATWIVTAQPYRGLDEEERRRGISAVVTGVQKQARASLDPSIKSGNYAPSLRARRAARRQGASEGILLSPEGWVAEGAASNLFWVSDGRLETPALEIGLLPGIIRAKLVQLATPPVLEVFAKPDRLEGAEELFATSSLWEALAITRLDGRAVGSGHEGPICGRLRAALRGLYRSNREAR